MGIHAETVAAALAAAAAIDRGKGLDIRLLDVSELLIITDVFVLATGTSRRHILTLAEEAEKAEDVGRRPLRREGLEDARWVLLDFGDFVVHVFDQETRSYYDLERLWGNAPRIGFDAMQSTA